MNISSKTFDSRRSKIDNKLFLKIIEPLKNVIKEEFDMDIDIFAVDGCKLSLSLTMNKYNYPTPPETFVIRSVRQNLMTFQKIKKEQYKKTLKKLFYSKIYKNMTKIKMKIHHK